MDKQDIELTKDMLDCFHALPKEALTACIWAFQNTEFVQSVAETEPYEKERMEQLIKSCLERKDYLLLFIALYKKKHDEKVMLEHSVKNPAPSV